MKKAIFLTLTTFFYFQMVSAQSIQLKQLNVRELPAKHGLDVFMQPQASDVSISIYNKEQRVIWDETVVKQNELRKRFNLKSLEDGDYSMIIESDQWRYEQGFTKKKSEIMVNDEDYNWLNFPEWVVVANNIIVPIQSKNNVLPTSITVFDMAGREVFAYNLTEKLHEKGMKFDLSNLASGHYDVALETEAKTFFKPFTKR